MSYSLPQFEALYSLDKKGLIRVFLLLVVDKADYFEIVTSAGLLKGKLTEKRTKVTTAKKGKTLEEQVILQANSLYESKINEGYKSLNRLEDYALANDIDLKPGFGIADIYKHLKITYNTDANWHPLPMLAEKWETGKKSARYPGYIQPKLNGVRCLALFDKDTGKVVFCSRGGKTYKIPHIADQLEGFFNINQNLVLDGEIFVHGKRLQEISGAVRREKDCPDWLEYHVYDIVDSTKTQKARLADLRVYLLILKTQFNARSVFEVSTREVTSEAEVKEYHDEFVAEGYEGAIYRHPNAPYAVSFRVNSLLKVKEFIDDEFEIIGCKVDPDKTVGESFVFELQNDLTDATFFARPTGSLQEKEFWYANCFLLIGQKATVRYQERTADNLPHQGHVRSGDTDCLTIEEVNPLK
jgi:hypothetical protein